MKNFELPVKVEAIVFYKDENEIKSFLAVKRSDSDGGFWQPVTGTLEAMDNIEGCLFREILEEVGIENKDVLSVSNCIYHFAWNKKNVGEINEYVFAVEVKKTVLVRLSSEHVDYKWGHKKEIRNLYEMPHNKLALDRISSS